MPFLDFLQKLLNNISILNYFRIVGDNIDHEIHARIQSSEHNNQSIHWTHQYAIRDCVVNPLLDKTTPQQPFYQLSLISLLPNPEVQAYLKETWKIIVSSVVTKYQNSSS